MGTDLIGEERRRELRENGFCVLENALTGDELARTRQALDDAVARMRSRNQATHDGRLDPNNANIRVYNLPDHDPIFVELLRWPAASEIVEALLGKNVIVSNFTANIALPGSGPMALHSDQALVIPEPWDKPWAMNVIWCLDDVYSMDFIRPQMNWEGCLSAETKEKLDDGARKLLGLDPSANTRIGGTITRLQPA